MKQKTKLTHYSCVKCKKEQEATIAQDPIIFVDVISHPRRCECGSRDFDAHIVQTIQLAQPIDFISVKIRMDDLKVDV